ncbi:MAG: cytochrome c3 family protein [Armatimonadetes bacterium]|nr:cytochrome c3 family protein [Armatimonadota bacterium]
MKWTAKISAAFSVILFGFLFVLVACNGGNGRPVIPGPGDGLIQPPGPIVKPTVPPERAFPTSLHGTRKGKATWYSAANGGFEALTGIPINQLGCQNCHPGTKADGTPIDPKTYKPDCYDCHKQIGDRVSDQVCLKCHRRQEREIFFKYPDVHRDAGYFRCMSCHTLKEMHGDGHEYASWLEPGAMDAACERCHRSVKRHASHDEVHLTNVHCTACHTKSVIACYNCHFESEVEGHIKRPYGIMRDFVFLVRRQGVGKVYSGTMMALTYKGKSFVAIAPYRAHTIVKEGRKCDECHNNAAVQEYNQTGKITVTKWNAAQGRLVGPRGIIPIPPDWRQALKFDFVDYTGDPKSPTTDPTKWVFLKSGADLMQMLYAEPLTPAQMQKLARPYSP